MKLEKYNGNFVAGLVVGLIGYFVNVVMYVAVVFFISLMQSLSEGGSFAESLDSLGIIGGAVSFGAIIWAPMAIIAGFISLKSFKAALWSCVAYACTVLLVTGTCTGLLMNM